MDKIMVLIIFASPVVIYPDFRKKHEFPNILMHDRQLHQFIIITIIVPTAQDSVARRENGNWCITGTRILPSRRIGV
jgi:hypothetical protein